MGTNNKKNIKRITSKKIISFFCIHWAITISVLFHSVLLVNKVLKTPKNFNSDLAKDEGTKRIKIAFKNKEKTRQIVTTENTKSKEKPKDTDFLGKKDQAFKRETSSRNIGSFKTAGKGKKDGKRKVVKNISKNISQGKRDSIKKGKSNKKLKRVKDLSLEKLGFGKKANQEKNRPEMNYQSLGLESGDERKTGLAQNNDYVEDIPLADMTNLNTIEYKYYGFYHRIKQKLEQYWGNTLQKKAEALWRSGRNIASNSDRMTSLVITIDNSGNIVEIQVKGSSGVQELDEAAIESFNRAGPFPNPPKGMMRNGMAQIEWGFVVKS